MDNFIKEVNKYSITLDCQREIDSLNNTQKITYDLIYEINEYEKLLNQDKSYIKKLRKNKIKVKFFKRKNSKNKIEAVYYKLYSHKRMSNKYINQRVNSILNKLIIFNGEEVTNDLFIQEQIKKRVHKTKKTSLNGEYEQVFSTISAYLDQQSLHGFFGNKEDVSNKEISLEKLRETRKFKKTHKFEKHKIIKEKHEKWLKRHKSQVKRWKKSNTYKHNKIYNKDLPFDYWDTMGLFDPEKHNISSWVLVNIDNLFYFNNQQFKINDNLNQYKVKNSSKDNYNFTNKSEMEKVLCFYVPSQNKYHFYDENIKNINNFIKKLSN